MYKRLIIIAILGVALGFCPQLTAQTARLLPDSSQYPMTAALPDTLGLETALLASIQNHYGIRLAQVRESIAENNVTRGNAGFLPRVSASVGTNWTLSNTQQQFIDDRTVSNPSAGSSALNGGVSVDWTFFDGFGMFRRYEILEATRDLQQLATQDEVRQTLADVSEAYYAVVYQTLLAQALQESMDLTRFRRELAFQRWQVGNGSRLDYQLASVTFRADSANYLRQLSQAEQARIRLNQLMNAPLDADYAVSDTIILADGFAYETLREQVYQHNTDLLMQEKQVELAQLDLELTKADRLPRISLFTDYGYARSRSDAGFLLGRRNLDWSYGLNASINIFDGFNVRRRIENAQLGILLERTALDENRLQVETELRTFLTQYEFFRELTVLEQENVAIAQENVAVEQERFQLGAGSTLESREAEQEYLLARNRYLQSLYQAKLAEVALARLTFSAIR